MVRFFKVGLLEMIGSGVDVLFANEDEARDVVGAADLDSAVDYLKTLSRELVITRGSKGALIWDGRTLIDIDPVKVEAVDTVGAGDMFAGAFLYARGQGWANYPHAIGTTTSLGKAVEEMGRKFGGLAFRATGDVRARSPA